MKNLLRTTLFYFCTVILLARFQCQHRNPTNVIPLKRGSSKAGELSHTTERNHKAQTQDPEAEISKPGSGGMLKAKQYCKQAEDDLNQSEKALTEREKTQALSRSTRLKQEVRDAAQQAKETAEKAESAAEAAAADNKAYDVQQRNVYAKRARTAANDAAADLTAIEKQRKETLSKKLQGIKSKINKDLKELQKSLNDLLLLDQTPILKQGEDKRTKIRNLAELSIIALKELEKDLKKIDQDLTTSSIEEIKKCVLLQAEEASENITKKMEQWKLDYQIPSLQEQLSKTIKEIKDYKSSFQSIQEKTSIKLQELQKVEDLYSKLGETINSGKGMQKRKKICTKRKQDINQLKNLKEELTQINSRLNELKKTTIAPDEWLSLENQVEEITKKVEKSKLSELTQEIKTALNNDKKKTKR